MRNTIITLKGIRRSLLLLFLLLPFTGKAQCTYKNTAFSGNEIIAYNLYFNWKFVWVKAGTATMYTVPSTYKGQKAYRTSLVTRSSSQVDRYFMMRDTILTYCSDALTPLYYRKAAREDKRYYVDEVWYTYPNGKCVTTIKHLNSNGMRDSEKKTYNHCVTDMLNAFQRIRNLNPRGWKKGHVETIDIAGGSELISARLVYTGKEKVKADNNKKYDCLVLSYIEKEDGADKEIVRFYVTDDQRHIPIRLDLFLRFGTAKAFLSSMKI